MDLAEGRALFIIVSIATSRNGSQFQSRLRYLFVHGPYTFFSSDGGLYSRLSLYNIRRLALPFVSTFAVRDVLLFPLCNNIILCLTAVAISSWEKCKLNGNNEVESGDLTI